MPNNKFKNLNVNFRDIMRLSVTDRVSMVRDPQGVSILADFTAEQLASMFPRYYSEKLPSISTSLSRIVNGKVNRDGRDPTLQNTEKAEQLVGNKSGSAREVGRSQQPAAGGRSQQPAAGGRSQQPATPGGRPQQPATPGELADWQKRMNNIIPGFSDKGEERPGQYRPREGAGERQAAIVREANKLKISPVDLAAVMSYESAGSMNPDRQGPIDKRRSAAAAVAKGAQPRMLGVIQFGAEEQLRYGITPGMSFSDQATAAGKFLKDRGLARWLSENPNATELERRTALYSTINAGGPDRKNWGATDRWMGGAPGGVADKVAGIFSPGSGHLLRAERLMKESYDIEASSNTQTNLPSQLPEGLDPKFLKDYEKFNATQKKEFASYLQSKGDKGVTEFNTLYSQNSQTATQTAINNPTSQAFAQASERLQMRDGWITAQSDRNWNQCVALSRAFNPGVSAASTWKVSGDTPIQPGSMVASRGYGNGNRGTPGRGYHTGIAMTAPDKDGNFKILDQSAGARAIVRTVNINSPLFKAGGIGVVEGSKLSMEALRIGANLPSTNEETRKNININLNNMQPTPQQVNDATLLSATGLTQHRLEQVIAPTPPRPELQASTENLPQKPTVGTRGSTIVAEPSAEPSAAPAATPPRPELRAATGTPLPTTQKGTGRSIIAAPPTTTATPQAAPQAPSQAPSQTRPELRAATRTPPPTTPEGSGVATIVAEPSANQAFALGGETRATGPLTAYSIDKDKMRRDDTIVTDGRGAKFTMNADKESMKYNPDTGKVQIDNARGEARQKINASQLGPEAKPEPPPPQVIQQEAAPPHVVQQPVPQEPQKNSFDTTTSLVDDIFKSPSFRRAISQTRFMKDSDSLDGHYDHGAY